MVVASCVLGKSLARALRLNRWEKAALIILCESSSNVDSENQRRIGTTYMNVWQGIAVRLRESRNERVSVGSAWRRFCQFFPAYDVERRTRASGRTLRAHCVLLYSRNRYYA